MVLAAVAVAAGVLYLRARDTRMPITLVIGGEARTVQPSNALSAAERAYLRGYLTLHAADLEKPAGPSDAPIPFAVHPGETALNVADRLAAAGLIRDATLFRHYLRYYDLDAGLEAGNYTLRASMTIPEVAQTLSFALADEIEIRITEGWRLEQTADYLAAHPETGLKPDEFLALARRMPSADELALPVETGSSDEDPLFFLAEIPPNASLEGYLFPDTYRLPADATAADLVRTMLYTFGQRVSADLRQGFLGQGLTLHQAVTLASIVEREAQRPEERPVIASVFLNRLRQGIKLDADPTVQYALGWQAETAEWWKRPLLLVDLQMDSPYNTYLYPGLPPAPIASPGLASMEAVAHPEATPYYYFVVDCTADQPGTHVFAVTFEEHQANVARCR